jgi:hypothetical protein
MGAPHADNPAYGEDFFAFLPNFSILKGAANEPMESRLMARTGEKWRQDNG